ncbi:uncharacterized protein LOC115676879 isoform X2 [Syzygium oleosum]|nr:uncharacterized protein LOC115676879 isoform X2 [Syzygium oleosum]XP_056161207.1 uncharacterized protein LOC115676879 isoform X2 [Syzygium oleosum]
MCRVLVEMPNRRGAAVCGQSPPLRRSPRFLSPKSSTGSRCTKIGGLKSDDDRVDHLDTPVGSKRKRSEVNSLVKDDPRRVSRKATDLSDGLRKSTIPCSGLRRSPRFNGGLREQEHSMLITRVKDYPERNSSDGLGRSTTPCAGLRRSPRLNCGVQEFRSFDQSLRNSNQQNIAGQVERTDHRPKRESRCLLGRKTDDEDKKDPIEDGVVNKCEVFVAETQRGTRQCVLSLPVLKKEENGKFKTLTESKQGDEGNKNCQGWTEEQEDALQRAYFSAKPTPHFWKKVSRFVPGKSAQECFDKIHSDHLTPTQPRLRSRANRRVESYIKRSPLSASKILKSPKPLIKRLSSKKKSLLAHKTVRQLLQKQNHSDQTCEADFFSVLEPNADPSTKELTSVLVTPDNLQKMQGSLLKCRERSSSGNKKPVSRFCSSSRIPLMSPPVLKQVKNRALHEKYLDQLHSREVKRNSALEVKVTSREANKIEVDAKKMGAVKAAKHALLSDVNDAINQLQHLQGNVATDSDEDILDRGDDDDDDEDG